jgi:hypothetical protein
MGCPSLQRSAETGISDMVRLETGGVPHTLMRCNVCVLRTMSEWSIDLDWTE